VVRGLWRATRRCFETGEPAPLRENLPRGYRAGAGHL